jgi:uncharacterized tellurite resistance protein B-like protein
MELPETELISYLANVIAVARADGSVSAKEATAIERIRSDLGAKKSDLNKALKLVEGSVHNVAKIGRLSLQVSNLEAMIYVALIDGTLSECESNIVGEFAADIGLEQKQLDQIALETEAAISAEAVQTKCSSCSAIIPATAKFCPGCGAAVVSTPTPEAQASVYAIPQQGFAIEFSESTSLNFQTALDFAKTAPSFTSALKGNKCWYVAGWPSECFEAVSNLANLLSGLRNRRLFVDGAERAWDDVFQFTWCAHQREQAYRPVEYCFGIDEKRINPFGCKQIRMEWSEWSDWFSFGSFRSSGRKSTSPIWVFDKDRIRHQANTNMFKFRYCPHMRSALIEAVIDALPDEVDPANDADWEFKNSYEAVPGSVKIIEKSGDENSPYRSEREVFGVHPRGIGALERLMTLAFRKAGIAGLNVPELLKQGVSLPPPHVVEELHLAARSLVGTVGKPGQVDRATKSGAKSGQHAVQPPAPRKAAASEPPTAAHTRTSFQCVTFPLATSSQAKLGG